jgi:hypothetical protein
MTTDTYISDQPLPPEQDFTFLKQKGLDFVNQYGGTEWTNLNPADPGVTILDQVCYALTELGYCGDFPVGDLLANPDSHLPINDQFYLPEQILTTSPITVTDYRKYIIDEVEWVENAVLIPQVQSGLKLYQVYLQISESIQDKDRIDEICKAVFFALNRCRNLCELFLMPLPLVPVEVEIRGQLSLVKGKDLSYLYEVQQRIRNYIFPQAEKTGWKEPVELNSPADGILNGPRLKKGWISTDGISEKKDRLQLTELNHFMNSIPGIEEIQLSGFTVTGVTTLADSMEVANNQLLFVDLIGSVKKGIIQIFSQDMIVPPSAMPAPITTLPAAGAVITHQPVKGVQTEIELPAVKYRDVNAYYSIQNTFPEIYATGDNAITTNTPGFQVAQSRQLKGYLTFFDQVLANQFAQLANIGTLISFKNATTGAKADTENFYAQQDQFQKNNPMYPVPFKTFSPTYFYQSLYDVPQIKPLLKDHDMFAFDSSFLPAEALEQKSWEAYKQNPYNPYIRGLMECVEDETENLTRRNDILDHLLARHGESPLVLNEIMDDANYAGDTMKNRVIIKSLLLQNLALLSYYRIKAVDLLAAKKTADTLPEIPPHFEKQYTGTRTVDFIENSEWIDEVARITTPDFSSFSALELKLNLLFGLTLQYRDFIACNLEDTDMKEKIQLALWMIKERRGLILLESSLLYYSLNYDAVPVTTTSILPQGTTNDNRVILIFPSFITQFNTVSFQKRLDLFLKNNLPAAVPYTCYFADDATMLKIIPAYAALMNSLRHPKPGNTSGTTAKDSATILTTLLNEISPANRE